MYSLSDYRSRSMERASIILMYVSTGACCGHSESRGLCCAAFFSIFLKGTENRRKNCAIDRLTV
jgi:hypothetical protein